MHRKPQGQKLVSPSWDRKPDKIRPSLSIVSHLILMLLLNTHVYQPPPPPPPPHTHTHTHTHSHTQTHTHVKLISSGPFYRGRPILIISWLKIPSCCLQIRIPLPKIEIMAFDKIFLGASPLPFSLINIVQTINETLLRLNSRERSSLASSLAFNAVDQDKWPLGAVCLINEQRTPTNTRGSNAIYLSSLILRIYEIFLFYSISASMILALM